MSKFMEVADVDLWSKGVTAILETNHLDGVRQIIQAATMSAKSTPLEAKALDLFGEHIDVFARRDWAGERVVYDEINKDSPTEILALKNAFDPIRDDYEASFCLASAALKSADHDSLLGRYATCVRDNYAYGLSARVDHSVRNKPAVATSAPK